MSPWDLTAIAAPPRPTATPPSTTAPGPTPNTSSTGRPTGTSTTSDGSRGPGPHTSTSPLALAPPAVGPPAAFTIDGPNSQHVIYRGTDNQIHEITWTTSPSASPGRQDNWRWCNKCQGLFHGGMGWDRCLVIQRANDA